MVVVVKHCWLLEKKKIQRKIIEDHYWIGAQENIYLSLFERPFTSKFIKLLHCTREMTVSCSETLRVFANFLQVVSAMTGNYP